MLLLDNNSVNINLSLFESIDTNEVSFFSVWQRGLNEDSPKQQSSGLSNGTNSVSIINVTDSYNTKIVKFISIYNNDSIKHYIILSISNNGQNSILGKFPLEPEERLEYTESTSFRIVDSSGGIKLGGLSSSTTITQSKILGQAFPSTTTDLYTVPTGVTTVCSSIVVCNKGVSNAVFRVSIANAGASLEDKQYIYYNITIVPNDTFIATIGITLSEGDVVRVYSDTGYVSFNLFGTESL